MFPRTQQHKSHTSPHFLGTNFRRKRRENPSQLHQRTKTMKQKNIYTRISNPARSIFPRTLKTNRLLPKRKQTRNVNTEKAPESRGVATRGEHEEPRQARGL
ncbi:hypothetical protein ACFX1R_047479 [Malus domestica]